MTSSTARRMCIGTASPSSTNRNSHGENVSSIEVEDVITSHPAVREVAVIGIPDATWGELVTALVVTDGSGVTAEELIAHCRTRLAGFKTPKRVDFVETLPRTATGKLQKFKLREPFWTSGADDGGIGSGGT